MPEELRFKNKYVQYVVIMYSIVEWYVKWRIVHRPETWMIVVGMLIGAVITWGILR